jgi:uncharacterized damage-inducible protein DinB
VTASPLPRLSVHPLVRDNLAVLQQGSALLDELDDLQYADTSWSGASIGGHFRHVLDHYLCLLRGLHTGVVDYDARERDPLVETDRQHAQQVVASLVEALQELDPHRPLSVQLYAGQTAGERLQAAPSSVQRELMFVLLHAVHHYALIATELRARGKRCCPTLGVAPATQGYRSRSC